MRREIALGLLIVLWGCQPKLTSGPPRITYGRDVCHHCGMIINEARFASGYVDDQGQSIGFDDLGEMLLEAKERPDLKTRLFAGDFEEEGQWLPAMKAFFVRAPGFSTPMGSGVVAFSSEVKARSFAEIHKGAISLPFEAALQTFSSLRI